MFDEPSRDVCSPRRIATNTPLQALVTLNSEVYTELAEALASRCQSENSSIGDAIRQMFRRVTTREPSSQDLRDLQLLYDSLVSEIADDGTSSDAIAREPVDERPPRPAQPSSSLRLEALTTVALAILNSDWALTK